MRRRVLAAAAGVLALSGCSATADSMQAAVSDEFTVSQAQVADQVSDVLTGLGRPSGQPPAGLATQVTQRLVQDGLAAAKADDLGITLSQGEVERGVSDLTASAGGQQALDTAALQAGIPVDRIVDTVRTQLLFAKIGQQLVGGSDTTAQQSAAAAELSSYSDAIDIRVAPRYGTWDDATLTITAGSSVVSPAPSASAG